MRIRTIICEDEPEARDGLIDQLRRDQDILIVATPPDGLQSVEAITTLAPDLVLLDIELPVMDGFEVVRRVGRAPIPVFVFITAYDKYAIRAFNVHAQDYLLKPFSNARFVDMLNRAKGAVRQRQARMLSESLNAFSRDT